MQTDNAQNSFQNKPCGMQPLLLYHQGWKRAIFVPHTLPMPGRVEDEINKVSQTLTPTIKSLSITHVAEYNFLYT